MDDIPHPVRISEQLEEWVSGDTFSCLAAKAALRRKTLRSVELARLASEEATLELHGELTEFADKYLGPEEDFATLIAVFDGPDGLSEQEFNTLLWRQLTALHELDMARGHRWAADVSADPLSTEFAFSVAGHPFFLVGMHSNASRVSRRFSKPAIAFNSHHQFRRLKTSGVYGGLQKRIRKREIRLQQSINPNLAEFGEDSEARQYAGHATAPEWNCPFRPSPEAKRHANAE
ncbi:guanitoxin biosynthesis heme-dependent pre-guanitoxin N-hydroxylase GntA [Streptomyces sp. B-S-A8]|uniref:Guanitoxin biosynthesis heme-dependent pre-guanitoxin N-hydroxylase GntA n=1 Tax=Streptomyces solicavernae TaxID=3043614 RepID=A0ABT6RY43_9ACTN|nr:guanitoxin biosynthesis heme-dependent pre-guanitoxin N-hydroxylase GntA [Streptomyces sp. B-S-A8]MDI3389354.1 guanitoxin biosynthesis heme-dependent pre-guanitoxin N-hydroxylase GntA [Streptomyces sp. B-S-A8]